MVELGLALLGTIGIAAIGRAEGPKKENPAPAENPSSGIISRLFPDDNQGPPWRMKAKRQKEKMEHMRPSASSKTETTKLESKKAAAPKEPTAQEKERAEVKREQADYLRRLAACDQLREIAIKNNDENLNRQADELQAQAWTIYTKHIAAMGKTPVGGEGNEESGGVNPSMSGN
jgi:hypothetical protein